MHYIILKQISYGRPSPVLSGKHYFRLNVHAKNVSHLKAAEGIWLWAAGAEALKAELLVQAPIQAKLPHGLNVPQPRESAVVPKPEVPTWPPCAFQLTPIANKTPGLPGAT